MLRSTLWLLSCLYFASPLHAQNYPDKPIRVVVPFAAGSGTDVLARIVTDELRSTMGASFVIDNRAGASGQIGAELVAKANPDGYTLFLSTNTPHSANPFLFKKLNYDPVRDFSSVSRMIYYVFILVVNPSQNVRTVPELIASIKANPGKTSYAFGNSTGQVNGAYFASAAKLDSLPVPYKSTPPAMTDLIGGRIQWMFVDAAASQGHVKAGRLRAIALMGDRPSDTMPDLPPVGATVPGFDTVPWAGMFAPARTPKHIIAKLNAAIVKAIEKPSIGQRLIDAGLQPAPSTPAQLDQFVKQQLAAWGKKIKDAGIQPE
ncbi:MAG TPA: tripartite tricarboxylate transporter substrate binding protein [Burkholderiales bacterium]